MLPGTRTSKEKKIIEFAQQDIKNLHPLQTARTLHAVIQPYHLQRRKNNHNENHEIKQTAIKHDFKIENTRKKKKSDHKKFNTTDTSNANHRGQ